MRHWLQMAETFRGAVLVPVLAMAAFCQQAPKETGIATEWDTRSNMAALLAHVKQLEPLVKQINPQPWVAKGATETYVKQLDSSLGSLQNLIGATERLAKEPDKLQAALDTFFRMERVEILLASLKEGARKYQSGALADQLTKLLAENSVHRDRLRQHLMDLAAAREQEFRIADEEAQRCRGILSRQSLTETKPESRRNRRLERR